ncbi:acetyltransferase [Chryseobacterium sp. JJR-5R]|uniref:acetyltransferase n=1 Tax=Chryseobacterium sp. JJR-5R TaxID=3093923 RepID=UPI002A76248D|nr:acetyltransferase [Chryseobacterium sp. JJR-5R]WPO83177.1 acetyltransferase [Chryseobacterium sp. JJR-5R]
MKQIIIYGVGKMAEFIYYSFQYDSQYEIIAFCVDDAYLEVSQDTLYGLPVLNFTDVRKQFPPESYLMHIAIGRNDAREIIFEKVLEAGYGFANYICSKANVWPDLVIGQNVFIDQASVIHPYVTIGDNCMLIAARIGHHCHIGSNSLLSGTSLAGNVTVGNNSFLGINSGAKESVRIGCHNIVGAGCFIGKNTKDGALIYQERTVQKTVLSKNIVLFNNGKKA